MSNAHSNSPATGWFKSSFSNPSQECVEAFFDTDLVHIRDSKDCGVGPVLTVPAVHWAGVLDEVAGRARAGSGTVIQVMIDADGGASLRARRTPDTVLFYTPGEWSAFVAGVHNAEFDLPSTETLAA